MTAEVTTTAEATTTVEVTTTAEVTTSAEAIITAETTAEAEITPPDSDAPHGAAETEYPALTNITHVPGAYGGFTLFTQDTVASDYLGMIVKPDNFFFGGLSYDVNTGSFNGDYLGVQFAFTEDSYSYYVGECAYSSEKACTLPQGYGTMYDSDNGYYTFGRWANGECVEEYSDTYQFPVDYIVKIDIEGIQFSNAAEQKFAAIYFNYNIAWVSTDLTVKWFMGDPIAPFYIESIDGTDQAFFDIGGFPLSLPRGVDFSVMEDIFGQV
jgi:hypothetical protein